MANGKLKNLQNDNTAIGYLYRFFTGIVFGFANVIPGVSGGTAMVVLGMYERIILLITDLRHRLVKELKFFVPIAIGMGAAIILFGSIMDGLITKYQSVMQLFFVGVIIFSIPSIAKKVLPGIGKINRTKQIACLAAFLAMIGIMLYMAYSPLTEQKAAQKAAEAGEYLPDHSVGHLLMLVVYGAIACATMIIPGISGSLVMVMLNQYAAIMAAIHNMDIIYLAPFGVGCVIGLLFCAKLIKYLLKNHERITYAAILGFVIGSIFPVFPGFGAITVGGVIAFLIGGACIVGCEMLAKD